MHLSVDNTHFLDSERKLPEKNAEFRVINQNVLGNYSKFEQNHIWCPTAMHLSVDNTHFLDSEGRLPEERLSAVKKKLLLVMVSSVLALTSTVISQFLMWGLLSKSLPAILFNQIDDLATMVQVNNL